MRRPIALAIAAAAVAVAPRAWGLDKQGSAHGGGLGGASSGFNVSGAVSSGVSIINPSYAARPDNTGLALMRYAAHADVDLIGQRLSIPLDVNMFSDRLRQGVDKFAPTELDLIGGVTSTWPVGQSAVEMGARFEYDRPLDRPGANQRYADLRTRYLYSLARYLPGLAKALRDGDVSGWATLGWFAYNPTYFARPNNTGRALFRYGLHAEVSTFDDLVSLGFDATMFTDRFAPNPLRPSELDFTPEIIFHRAAYEVHLAYEWDMPLDQPGISQRFLYLLAVWSFDLAADAPAPLQSRGEIHSP
jgi:hypothetical protein